MGGCAGPFGGIKTRTPSLLVSLLMSLFFLEDITGAQVSKVPGAYLQKVVGPVRVQRTEKLKDSIAGLVEDSTRPTVVVDRPVLYNQR